jgi:hypothetical protein
VSLDVVCQLCFDKEESSYNSSGPFSTYLVGNSDIVPPDLLYSLSSRVFAFRENRTMYPEVHVHVQSFGGKLVVGID